MKVICPRHAECDHERCACRTPHEEGWRCTEYCSIFGEAVKCVEIKYETALKGVTEEQITPKGNGVDIAELVKADIEARSELGRTKYGERLQAFNGRDTLMDAYQEALDLCQYLRQAIYERDNKTGE